MIKVGDRVVLTKGQNYDLNPGEPMLVTLRYPDPEGTGEYWLTLVPTRDHLNRKYGVINVFETSVALDPLYQGSLMKALKESL